MRPDGEHIRRRRRRIGLDQDSFASRAGVDVKTLRRIESNQTRRPQAATIRAIAGALGCRPEELFEVPVRARRASAADSSGLTSCSACDLSESDAFARFCRRCGCPLRESELGARKPATVIAVRVQNLGELRAQIDEASERRLLDAVHEAIRPGVERFEGTLQRSTQGSSAIFGSPVAHEDHAARACLSALWLAAQLPRLRERLRAELGCAPALGLGLHSGRLVVRGGAAATGRIAEIAASLAEQGPVGRIYLTEETQRAVKDVFRVELAVRAGEPASAPRRYVLERSSAAPTRFDAAAARGLLPMIGRRRELAALHAALADVSTNGGRVVAVVGDAGVGKSRLCHDFAEQARALGCSVQRVVCPSHGRMVPLLPVLTLARQLLAVASDAPRAGIAAALAGLAGPADRSLEARLLLDLLTADDVDASECALPSLHAQEMLFALIRDLLARQGPPGRSVLVLEDVHWMGPSQRFLAGLVAAVRAGGLFVVVSFRPDHLPSWLTSSSVDRIVLRPLERPDGEALVNALLGQEVNEPGLVRRIVERAGGNAFIAEELVQLLVDGGRLAGEPGAYRSCGPIGELGLPPRVEDMVAARIDRLPPARRRLLHAVAARGIEVPEQHLAGLPDTVGDDLCGSLCELQWLDLLFEVHHGLERRFQVKHPIVREVARLRGPAMTA